MRIIKIFTLAILCLASASCIKEKLEEGYAKQEKQIDSYFAKNQTVKRTEKKEVIDPETGEVTTKDTTVTDTLRIVYNMGSSRLVRKEGEGPMLTKNGAISFYYAGYVFTGSPSKLFITNHQATAEDPKNKFIVTDPDYNVLEADMRHDDFIEGLYNGLIGVRAGEECEIAFSGKHGFGNVVFGTIPANSALLYRIWVIGVSNE